MLSKRIIACLDVEGGRVVKGVKFAHLRDVGDPIELARRYEQEGADEIVFLDITASHERRETMWAVVRKTAEVLFVPLTVGGGIRSPEDMRKTLNAGADKVAINTAAVHDPTLITRCAAQFGNQCVVVAIDAKRRTGGWNVFTHGGRNDTGRDAMEWAIEAARLGAGELLVTSMDGDGTRDGYDNELNAAVSAAVTIPVIASGGCGQASHMRDALAAGADAALAASIFHDAEATIGQVKKLVHEAGIPVRLG